MPPLQCQIYACGETRGEIVTSGEQNSTVRKTLFGYEKQGLYQSEQLWCRLPTQGL
jgi:hypothetical protein